MNWASVDLQEILNKILVVRLSPSHIEGLIVMPMPQPYIFLDNLECAVPTCGPHHQIQVSSGLQRKA